MTLNPLVQRDRFDNGARNRSFLQSLPGSGRQREHVIVMRLSGVFRIFAFSMQRIFGNRGTDEPASAIHKRDADIQSTEIDARNNGHFFASPLVPMLYLCQPRYM